MNVNGQHYRTIWLKESDHSIIEIIDQRWLPHQFNIEQLKTVEEVAIAIKDMHIRGAGLIGATAAYGMYLASLSANGHSQYNTEIDRCATILLHTRPTAVNLSWAINKQLELLKNEELDATEKIEQSKALAIRIADEDAQACHDLGQHGLGLIADIANSKDGPVNVLTHCNAGWLAFVDHGSATAPIYAAFDNGLDIHVWVDETRPRNQGARLTAWELGQHGVKHTIIPDNAAGHVMQRDMVDIVITGTDRTTFTGDVANKIGTYQKALAAKDNNIPFYVALPSSSFDWTITDGIKEIPIEKRDGSEVHNINGLLNDKIENVRLTPADSPAVNFAFDVTPARLVTGLITERGICEANEAAIRELFPQ